MDQGTTQFMSAEILEGIRTGAPLKHEIHHDLESFCWVFIYCIYRKLERNLGQLRKKRANGLDIVDVLSAEEIEEENSAFTDAFGRTSFKDIVNAKFSMQPMRDLTETLGVYLSDTIISVIHDLTRLVGDHTRFFKKERRYMTHDMLISKFDEGVTKLEAALVSN